MIVHQFDPSRPSPGGIDTCIRGLCRYAPEQESLAIVGVDTGGGPPGRKLGRWEEHILFGRKVWFMPVARLDPGNQRRRIPHSLRLIAGLILRYRSIPKADAIQAHRMDVALSLLLLFRFKLVYFIHTQESGLMGKTSDSWWKYLGRAHEYLEKWVVERSSDVRIFNEKYADKVAQWNPSAKFSPTWFDPALLGPKPLRRPWICWVGRLEVPKDPELALRAFQDFVSRDGQGEYELHIVGSGTLMSDLRSAVAAMPPKVSDQIKLRGRQDPQTVAEIMGESSLFLMTSHPGYEGYPRVLVEALASGLPAVVTDGSDTGGLVTDAMTGYVASRNPSEISDLLSAALTLSRDSATGSVSQLSAPTVVAALFNPPTGHR